jgi:hypothetical protein
MKDNFLILIFMLALSFSENSSGQEGAVSLMDLSKMAFSTKVVHSSETVTKPVEIELYRLRDSCLEYLRSGQDSEKKIAARLLGVLRSEQAIDLLVANITLAEILRSGSGVPGIEGIEDYPACAALVYIGGPNVLAAVKKARLSSAADSLESKLMDMVIVRVSPRK